MSEEQRRGEDGPRPYGEDERPPYAEDPSAGYGEAGPGAYGEGAGPATHGGWEPMPRTEYDVDATAFVRLPEDMMDAAPLAAPGHGYVPPRIPPAGTDPAATGSWQVPPHAGEPHPGGYPVPSEGEAPGEPAYGTAPQTTAQWTFTPEPAVEAAYDTQPQAPAASDVTGEWTIPVAGGRLPEDSGEFQGSSLPSQLSSQWGTGTAPATLPGGALAPWATQPEPEAAAPGAPEAPEEEDPAAAREGAEPAGADTPEGAPGPAQDPAPAQESEPKSAPEPEPGSAPEPDSTAPEDAAPEDAAPEDAAPVDSAHGPSAPEDPAPDPESVPGADAAADTNALPLPDEHPLSSYTLTVNGIDRPVSGAWIGESLLYVLRERLGLAGAKDGCSQGECGACAVQVDGRLVASCLVPAATTAGSEVRTVEGLASDGEPSDVQRALAASGAVQCGFCVPGMAMTIHDLLEGNPAPTTLEARQALCGNLCRCSGYRGVLDAVNEVAERRKESAEAHAAAKEEAAAAVAQAAEADEEHPRIPHQLGHHEYQDRQDHAAPAPGGPGVAPYPPPPGATPPHGTDHTTPPHGTDYPGEPHGADRTVYDYGQGEAYPQGPYGQDGASRDGGQA
ncbi:2Fe-2S iron-sulfur cluster-binding protein [Streptomyces sp. NPDC007088]|uniref:(2Fe-2S)-binding protein n=1 Tax=Streptomyces sp. NPDC007088 TaxID=3364773 RepID=UPI0036B0F7D6